MSRLALIPLLYGLLAAGCAAPPAPPRLASDHPASSSAPESPLPVPSHTLAIGDSSPTREAVAGDAPAAASGTAAHHHGGNAATQQSPATQPGEFTCPMHHQIAAHHPGMCPICGMKLVAVPAAAATRPAGEGAHP